MNRTKLKAILFATLVIVGVSVATLHSQPTPDTDTVVTSHPELDQLMQHIQTKIEGGQHTEADFADDLKSFDALIAKDKGTNNDEAAQLTYMKAILYVQVIKDFDKASTIMQSVATDYPDTKYGQNAVKVVADIARMAAEKKMQDKLAIGTVFPDFAVTNLNGAPLSVHDYKGKIVLLDFWATWCPPCRAELPNVIEVYKKYHPAGFEIIGINLDSHRDDLDAFLKQTDGMTWAQYSDGYGWTNVLVQKYGVTAIPSTILIGPTGKIINRDIHGDELEKAVAEAMTLQEK